MIVINNNHADINFEFENRRMDDWRLLDYVRPLQQYFSHISGWLEGDKKIGFQDTSCELPTINQLKLKIKKKLK